MKITEVSEKYQISVDTLRYYERVGLIPPIPRMKNGIRYYGSDECYWIELAINMRRVGLSIESSIKYVRLCQAGHTTIADRLQLLRSHKETLVEQQTNLTEMLKRLNLEILACESM